MIEGGIVSKRYAKALFLLALEQKDEERVYREMNKLSDAYLQVKALKEAVESPILPQEEKIGLLSEAAGGDVSDTFRQFVRFVFVQHRERFLCFISYSFLDVYRQNKQIYSGCLTTALPMDESVESKVRSMVTARTQGATLELLTKIDPEILGGFVLEMDTYRVDASVATQLKNIRKQLNDVRKYKAQ